MVTGTSVHYVSATGTGHIPLPRGDNQPRRTAHAPQPPRPTGLDWDALKPTCSSCGTKSSELVETRCPTCRGVTPTKTPRAKPANSGRMTFTQLDNDQVERRFTPTEPAPTAGLGADLDHLEATDSDVAAAVASLDDVTDRITRPDDHVRPEHLAADHAQETTVTSPPFPTYIVDIAVVLRDSENHPDPEVRTARKVVANALVGLNRQLTRYGDPAASTMQASPPTGVRIPPPLGTRGGKLRPHHADLIGRYLAGASTVELGQRYGVTDGAIGLYLRKHGIATRNNRRTTTTGAATA
jgi:hypothetical protein